MREEGPQGRAEVKALLSRHGLRPQRRLGQHFLVEPTIVDKIVAVADLEPDSAVVEVGAGTGTLTRALAAAAGTVVSYEIDTALRGVLEEVTAGLDVALRFEDGLSIAWAKEFGDGAWTLVANLPYNVGTVLLLDAVRAAAGIRRFVVMVQREVADRLVAEAGSKQYGVPSVIVRLHTAPRLAFRVPATAFMPPPEVESAVVVLDRVRSEPLAQDAARLASIAFQQRRKMLRGSLAGHASEDAFAAAGIASTSRPEELGADDFLRLAAAIE